MAKPSVFSIESTHRPHEQHTQTQTKPVSIINQPLPEIPTQQSSKSPQVLCASNLSNFPTNYRSLQRPQNTKTNFNTGTTQRNKDSRKIIPPILPPKNRNQRAQQPLPSIPIQSYNQQQQLQYPQRGYERERIRDRDRTGRSYDDSHQFKSSKQLQQQQLLQQQNFQTLPHHHHYPQTTTTTFSSGANTGIKNNRKSRGSRELLQQPFENYSATEL